MQLAWGERSYPITGGVTMSLLFHILLALLIILGVPSFFKAEILPTPEGIQATIVSDVTAAPKVDKQGKPEDKPKPPQPPAPEVKKPTPPKPTTEVAPTPATPPPAAAPEKAVAIPDETKKQPDQQKKPDTPKPDQKKVEKKPDEKPKQDKQQQAAMDALLKNLTKEQPAPKSQDKPKPNAQAAPAQPTVGPQASLVNNVPMTASDEDAIRAAIEHNWSMPVGMKNIESYVIMLRLYMNPDGTVQNMELIDPNNGDQGYVTLAGSAERAVEITVQTLGRLPMPQDKSYPTIVLRFDMQEVCNENPGDC